jgi:hypothetical protein
MPSPGSSDSESVPEDPQKTHVSDYDIVLNQE